MHFEDTFSKNSCQCAHDPLPEWFKQFMKKFKKKLLHDLRSSITEMVHEEFVKEKKLTEAKLLKSDKNEFSSPIKLKKKKNTDKETDLSEKREMKLLKKTEKLHSCKFDRLMQPVVCVEKLESKANPFLEERKTLLEREHKSKPKDAKKTREPEKKHMKSGKFTLLSESYIFLFLQPGAEFSFTVNVVNDGTVSWVSPRLECSSAPDIWVKQHVINLPRLEPGQSVSATLRGKAPQRPGHYHFDYKLLDDLEEFGPRFSCFAVVPDSKKKISKNSEQLKPDNTPAVNLVGTVIDLENVMIASSQKKIKENITEIEKRLQDIDLLKQYISFDESRKERLDDSAEEFQVRGCDPKQGRENKYMQEKLEGEMGFGVGSLQQKEETEKSRQKGDVKSENFQAKKHGSESDSDSELSVILTSEEDENFIFVSLLPESPNSETVNNTTKSSKVHLNKESNEVCQKPKEGIVEEHSVKVEVKEVSSKEINAAENSALSRSLTEDEGFSEKPKPSFEFVPISTIAAPPNVISNECSRESVPGNGSQEIFGEMDFPLGDVTGTNANPTASHSSGETTFSRDTKTEEKRSHDQSASHYVLHQTQELQEIKMSDTARESRCINVVPVSDRFGRPVYAVKNDGSCFPVKILVQNKVKVPDAEMEEEARNNVKKEGSTNYKTNCSIGTTIPIGMRSGASSVAAMAFNTAKSVINNLQSAFKPEVEIKSGDIKNHEPPEEPVSNFPYNLYSMGEEERHYVETLPDQEKYMNAILTLHEMGFVNHDLNFRLLKKYESKVEFVISEILDMPVAETPHDAE